MGACSQTMSSEAGSLSRMMVLTIIKCNRLEVIWDGFRLEKPSRWWAGRHKTTASGRAKSSRPRYSNSRGFRQARSPQAGQERFVRATVAGPSVRQSGKRSTLDTEKRMQSRRGFSIAPARIRTSYYTRRARQKKSSVHWVRRFP